MVSLNFALYTPPTKFVGEEGPLPNTATPLLLFVRALLAATALQRPYRLQMEQLDELATFAGTLADAARKEILPYWRKPLQVESKHEAERPDPESPVTIADRNAETAMRKLIEAKFPTHGIYGEEFGSVREESDFCWVLDPIDGTKAFITGKPLFGTLIGLCHKGIPVIGIIDQCVLNERWVGVSGKRTTLNGEPCTASGVPTLGEAMLYATTPHMFGAGFESERFGALRDAVKRPLYGCDCYAYALVASGYGADMVVEADLGLYDYAALAPVVIGAGGVMSDWNGEPLTIQRHAQSKGRVVAAANAQLHRAAVAILNGDESDEAAAAAPAIKPHLRKLTPYLPPLDGRDSKRHLLLDFNERTVPVPSHVLEGVTAGIEKKGLQTYPAYGDLNELISNYAGVKVENCMFTNGSDQGIDLVVRCCCPYGTEAIIPAPTFAMYEQSAMTEGLTIRRPFFTLEGGFPTEEVLAAIGPKTSLVVLSNPNNPSGTEIQKEDMIRICQKAANCAVLVDECYFEFMAPETSMKDEVLRFPNLFVTRTFSKTWGMPSLRLGYLISAEANIRALCCVRGPYDVNQCSVEALRAAMASPQYVFDFVKEHNTQSRPYLEEWLTTKGIRYWPTAANYIFCYFEDPPALEKLLRARGILVRPKKDAEGVTGLRMSIGTLEQTKRLSDTLEECMAILRKG